MLAQLRAAMRGDQLRPYMRLWLEICAQAAGGEELYRQIGSAIADGFIAWAKQRLLVDQGSNACAQAALLVATIDGLALLDTVSRGEIADPAIFR
ncbi:hypothetical protein HJG53_03590 [Sphingomonas sp. ID1715]|uniref:hypothetical protein n=1 Tax=Sphingomonas sp. ID1715 TaxID=1656898 RepID=UPI0017B61ED7|nr:hypothetical protein [Sphingomonas sp. ID1715]NNM75990.1 hypothetical protein [Sphingomonas sp. ID1715]